MLCEHGNISPCVECDIEPLRVENEKLREKVVTLVDALEDMVSEIESNTCPHDNTYRGGVIWEVCEDCGEKWADDMGGKPEFSWPESVETARNLIHTYRKQGVES